MIIEKCVLDIKSANIDLLEKDEIFVLVEKTKNYWISNYGRLVSNLHGKFRLHKFNSNAIQNIHYTITGCDDNNNRYSIDTYTDKLVAQAFLEYNKTKTRIWHIDRNRGNSYWKNLIYVSNEEFFQLKMNFITVESLRGTQEYKPFITNKRNNAYRIYNGILARCCSAEAKRISPHYERATIYEGWKKDAELFVEWYESNYYDCMGESMQVDKDLLSSGNKEYAPDKCCILPATLNGMLANSKKHRAAIYNDSENLPFGVAYDKYRKKYFSRAHMNLQLGGEAIIFGYHDTPEEAFEEYKKHKEAYILVMADRYKNYIPDKIYNALLKFEVKPY